MPNAQKVKLNAARKAIPSQHSRGAKKHRPRVAKPVIAKVSHSAEATTISRTTKQEQVLTLLSRGDALKSVTLSPTNCELTKQRVIESHVSVHSDAAGAVERKLF